jgi:hypothetical protein
LRSLFGEYRHIPIRYGLGPSDVEAMRNAMHATGEGKLLAFLIAGSAKVADLAADGRYALHAHQDPAVPHEFQVRGRAHEVHDRELRAAAAAAWSFEVDDGYRLFEFGVEHAISGERASADDWPPVYTSWRAAGAS